jgi:hypothetical protein
VHHVQERVNGLRPESGMSALGVRRGKAALASGCKSQVAADKAASLGGESPSAVSCLIQTASIPDARKGNDA